MHAFYKNLRFLSRNKSTISTPLFPSLPGRFDDLCAEKGSPNLEELLHVSTVFNLPVEQLILTDLEARQNAASGKIKALFLDVDGVLTDGGMYYSETGDELKKFNTQDGMALKILVKKGFYLGFISSGFNESLIKNRAKLLGVERVYAGQGAKLPILEKWCEELKITPREVAFVGDDVNDIPVLQSVGLAACPADAQPEVKREVHVILRTNGGRACVRELAREYLL